MTGRCGTNQRLMTLRNDDRCLEPGFSCVGYVFCGRDSFPAWTDSWYTSMLHTWRQLYMGRNAYRIAPGGEDDRCGRGFAWAMFRSRSQSASRTLKIALWRVSCWDYNCLVW